MSEVPFNLGEGEVIIEEIKPVTALRWYFFITWISPIIFIFIWVLWLPVVISPFFGGVAIAIFLIVLLGLAWIFADKRYNHQHYWLTNKRVIYKRGILGYRISSIPLERISDVIVSRTFVERLFGFGSVLIQSLAGQITYGKRLGAEGSLLGLSNPEDVQKKIFDLIKHKRKEEHLTM